MASSPAEQIKEKLDVVELIRGYVTLQSAGKNFKGPCPFHKEKTPSFMVSPERQSWHCFGCSLGGDVFAFLMRYENLEFGDALKVLAEKAGVELQRMSVADYHAAGLLYDINATAKEFFRDALERSREAQEYLRERGLTPATMQEFELGWALPEQDALSLHLLNRGYRPDDILRAGLTIKTERGMQFDRFRGRIMFPIHNHVGKVAGFTGRVLPRFDDGQMGKYMNSPESAIFSKSKLLYGFWKSKTNIRERGCAFLVEGQMDFLMSYQAGVRHAVATSGTALTGEHLKTLRRFTDRLIISFDSDEAGMAAGERAIDFAGQYDFDVRVVSFTRFKDPAEAAQADPGAFHEALARALPAPEFYFRRYLGEVFEHGNREHLRRLRIVLGKIKQIASPVERNAWVRELLKRTLLDPRVLLEEADRVVVERPVTKEEAGEPSAVKFASRRELVSQELLASALLNLAFVDDCIAYLPLSYQRVASLLKTGARRSDNADLDSLLHFIFLRADGSLVGDTPTLKKEVFKEYVRERRQELTQAVKRAEASGDEAMMTARLKELSALSEMEVVGV